MFRTLITIGGMALATTIVAQSTSKTSYFSGGSEIAFTSPLLDVNGSDKGAVIRFAPVVNVQQYVNRDLSDKFGLFIGLSVGNVGFIYDDPNSD